MMRTHWEQREKQTIPLTPPRKRKKSGPLMSACWALAWLASKFDFQKCFVMSFSLGERQGHKLWDPPPCSQKCYVWGQWTFMEVAWSGICAWNTRGMEIISFLFCWVCGVARSRCTRQKLWVEIWVFPKLCGIPLLESLLCTISVGFSAGTCHWSFLPPLFRGGRRRLPSAPLCPRRIQQFAGQSSRKWAHNHPSRLLAGKQPHTYSARRLVYGKALLSENYCVITDGGGRRPCRVSNCLTAGPYPAK